MIDDVKDITSFKWATVTTVSPLAVKLDGDTAPLAMTPDSLVDPASLAIGARVRVELSMRKCVIHGAASGGSPTGEIKLTAAAAAPAGWLLCQGQQVQRSALPGLFGAIGTTFGGLPTTVRTNYAPNPSAEVDASGFQNGGSFATFVRSTAKAWIGAASIAATMSATSGSFFLATADATTLPSVPGDIWTASTYVQASAAATGNVTIRFCDAGGATLRNDVATSVAISTTGWTRISMTSLAAPASTAYVLVYTTFVGTASTIFYHDGVLIEKTNTLGAYFDGGTAVDGTTGWLGNIGKSRSIQGLPAFNLPDLRGRVPVGQDATQTEFDVLGEKGGAKRTGHAYYVTGINSGQQQASGSAYESAVLNQIKAALDVMNGSNDLGAAVTIQSVGGGIVGTGTGGIEVRHHQYSVTNLQPYLALNYMIKT